MIGAEEAIRRYVCRQEAGATKIFRGHGSSTWKLVPNLFRSDQGGEIAFSRRHERLTKFWEIDLPTFKAKYHLLYPGMFIHETDLFWAGLAQHFGVKSPLLDWTHSPFVALMMVYSSTSNDTTGMIFELKPAEKPAGLCIADWPQMGAFRRIVAQKGLFSYMSHENLNGGVGVELMSGSGTNKIELDCSNAEKKIGLEILNYLGVSGDVLFPESIDHAAKFIN